MGLGRSLLKDALVKTALASNIAGLRSIVAYAKNKNAQAFYHSCGFEESTIDNFHMMLPMQDLYQFTIKGAI